MAVVSGGERIAAGAALIEQARAKLNLSLQVTGRRASGYHELESLVVFAAVGDVVTVRPADHFTLAVDGPFAAALAGAGDDAGDNLVLRAARALAARVSHSPGAAMTLTKNLPVASGIGGGSADAAAALRGLARLWKLHLPAHEWQALALEIGADVPVCLGGEAVMMSGIGERLQPVAALPPLWLLLVNPGVAVSTAAVFAARDGGYATAAEPRLPPGDLAGLLDWLVRRGNDLQVPACRLAPIIGEVLAALRACEDCLLARMSGSGATCFGLFESERSARSAAAALARRQQDWWVMPARLCA